MMHLGKQQREILEQLKTHPEGINSYEYRMKWIQLPVRVKELKQKGFKIIAHPNKNRSVNYILEDTPDVTKSPVTYERVENEDGYYVMREVKNEQQKLL